MKKLLVTMLSVALIGGAIAPAAQAKKPKKVKPVTREATLAYQCPCGPYAGGVSGGFWLAGGTLGGGTVADGSTETFVSGKIVDQSGQSVMVELAQDTDGDSQAETEIGTFCGSTKAPLAIPNPGVEVSVFILEGQCDGGTASVATSGTLTLTFSNVATQPAS